MASFHSGLRQYKFELRHAFYLSFLLVTAHVRLGYAFEIKTPRQADGQIRHLPLKTLNGDEACSRCHVAIGAQWRGSSHRFSSFNNPYYAHAAKAFIDEHGEKKFKFCARCHDPALVAQDLSVTEPAVLKSQAAHAGITCIVCHRVDSMPKSGGNAQFTVSLSDVGPRKAHGRHMTPVALTTGAVCLSCHDVTVPATITGDRSIHGQDDALIWRHSIYGGSGLKSPWGRQAKTCIDCHMPRVKVNSRAPAATGGYIRSHEFLGANTAIAQFGESNNLARHEAFMRSAVEVSMFQEGPYTVSTVLYNRGTGHRFPGGVNDSNQAWLEITAFDDSRKVVARHGHLDPNNKLPTDTYLIRRYVVDQHANPIQQRRVADVRGMIADTSLYPLWPRMVRWVLPTETHTVKVRLLYRQFSEAYARGSCQSITDIVERMRCQSPPMTEIYTTSIALSNERAQPRIADKDKWVKRALALSDGIARDILEGQKILEALADQDDTDRLVKSGLAYAYWRLGRTDDVVHLTDDMPTNSVEGRFGLWVRLNALADAYRFKEALYVGQRLQKLSPQDVQLRMLVSRLHGNLGHWDKALKAAAQGVRDAPQLAEGWYLRFQANQQLGHHDAQAQHEWWYRRQRHGQNSRLKRTFWRRQPHLAAILEPVPTFDLKRSLPAQHQ